APGRTYLSSCKKMALRCVSISMDAASEQRRGFVGLPRAQATVTADSSPSLTSGSRAAEGRRSLRPPSRRRPTAVPLLGKAAREERASERAHQREQEAIEAAKQAFFETPAGRARHAYKQGHRLFQYELEISKLQPLLVPGVFDAPSRWTSD